MPNHVTTIITGPQEALAALLNDAGQVDFGFLIPEPANIEQGGCSHQHAFEVMFGDAPLKEEADGTICWYAWNVKNWGTKWNAYSYEVSEGCIQFDTAWSHPFPVIQALSLKYPETIFEVKFADEDLGSNLGEYAIRGGEVFGEKEFTTDEEALDFAAQVKYGQSYAELKAEWGEE